MLNLFRITMVILAALVAYYGFGVGGKTELLRKSAGRRQAATNFFYRRECSTISQVSMVFADGPGFNKTFEFRKACISRSLNCTFFINPTTVQGAPALSGQIPGLLADGMTVGLSLPIYPADLDKMDETTFKNQLYGHALSVKQYMGGTTFPRFVFFKYGINWNTEQQTAKWAMDLGFMPVKAQVYLQDLTSSASDILGVYKSTLDPYVAGGSRLKYIFAHTHMDQSLLVRSDIESYVEFVRSYKYKIINLSECLGVSPYLQIADVKVPDLNGSNGATGLTMSIMVMLFSVLQVFM